MDYGRSPAIDSVFQSVNTLEYYWSSTTATDDTSYAWVVYSVHGGVFSRMKTDSFSVRCVRGNPLPEGRFTRDDIKQTVTDTTTGLMWQDDPEAKTVVKTWSDAIAYCENKTLGGVF